MKCTINGNEEIEFYQIWYHHNAKVAGRDDSCHYRVEVRLPNEQFRQVLETQTALRLEDPNLEERIKEKFSSSSFNPIQWLLDIEDQDYLEREGENAPWDVKWVFTDISRFALYKDIIVIEGTANPAN